MDRRLLRLFQNQIGVQCRFALLADCEIRGGLTTSDQERVFCGITNLLNALANISKALWGSGGGKADDRQELRDSLDVGDTSALKQTFLRNHFEHYDERLERWIGETKSGSYLDLVITAGDSIDLSAYEDKDIFRLFDVRSSEVVFWGERFDIGAALDEVKRLNAASRNEFSKIVQDFSDGKLFPPASDQTK